MQEKLYDVFAAERRLATATCSNNGGGQEGEAQSVLIHHGAGCFEEDRRSEIESKNWHGMV